MAEYSIQAFREIPRGSKASKAFSAPETYCEGNFFQEHTLPASGWIDLGFEWIARDVPTVLTTWPFVTVAVSVDGEEIENPKQQSKGPDEVTLQCADETQVGCVMANALYIPSPPAGDHTVIWTVGFEREVDDGWTVHPKGETLVITCLLHIVRAA